METNKRKRLRRKQSLTWHFVRLYLECLLSMVDLMRDKEFQTLYQKLIDHVDGKILVPNGGDILEQYVITEQEAEIK